MTAAGTVVAVLAATLTVAGLTGGCDNPDTAHLDRPRVTTPAVPPPVLHVGPHIGYVPPDTP